MNEISRIKKLITDHFDGNPWLDVSIKGTLKKVTARQAVKKVGDLNSIWQIVNHMIDWREALCKKLKGETITVTENNFFEDVIDVSEKEWRLTLKRLERSQKDILSFLTTLREFDFDKVYSNGHTSYEHLQAILQHDAYHLGQIVLLKKLT